MGRELRKVALDFVWPVGQLWKGFVNPFHSQKCESCDGSGQNPATKKLSDDWYSFGKEDWVYLDNGRRYNNAAWQNHITEIEIDALLKADRLWDFTRIPINKEQEDIVKKRMAEGHNSWLPFNNGKIPTPDEVNNWNRRGMGHDGSNQWICVRARAEHLGVYGSCEFCDGEGEIWQSEEIKKLHDDWKEFDPPTGEGFQLWSTTTEGHPMTPVFNSLEALCEYCEKENVSVFGSNGATKEKWMKMLSDDHVYHQEGNIIFV